MSDRVKSIISIMCVVAAIVVAVIAMYFPPVGVIDVSVLWFTAQLLVFTASIIGIKLQLKDVFQPHNDKSKN